ncbi:MAG: hypothetical protein HKN82_19825, partial [Akkermansiaceae bacterium]|nr:hypothetical protein [Akkermansiaceae bacterium]
AEARARREALAEAERRRAEEQQRAAREEQRRREQAEAPDPPDPPKPAPKTDYPVGIPIPGREGMVTVPSAGHDQPIDVRGIPSGTLVKDPVSGTKFRVP